MEPIYGMYVIIYVSILVHLISFAIDITVDRHAAGVTQQNNDSLGPT